MAFNIVTLYIGIDISKLSFDACFVQDAIAHHQKFTNNLSGFNQFLIWLDPSTRLSSIHIVMEATSTYWQPLANWAFHQNLKVSVVNPLYIRAYAKAVAKRIKNDKQDAALLARYGQKEQPRLWIPKLQEYDELNALVVQRFHHKKTLVKERTRLETASCHTKHLTQQNIQYWQDSLNQIDTLIWQLIKSHRHLSQHAKLLASIPGIGKKTIPVLLNLIGDGTNFENAKQLIGFVGLAPREYQSGTSISKQAAIGKAGRPEVKETLFMPAVVIGFGRHRAFTNFVDRLNQQGKPKKQIIVALMRKLLVISYQVIKNNTPFDPSRHT